MNLIKARIAILLEEEAKARQEQLKEVNLKAVKDEAKQQAKVLEELEVAQTAAAKEAKEAEAAQLIAEKEALEAKAAEEVIKEAEVKVKKVTKKRATKKN